MLKERQRPDTPIRLGTAVAVGFSVLLPLIEVGRMAVFSTAIDPMAASPTAIGPIVSALIATTLFLPLHLRIVVYAVRGSRPAGAGWTLAAMTVVIVGATPLIGVGWLFMFASLGLAVLVVVRPPWSFLLSLGLTAAMAPLALALGERGWAAVYFPIDVAWRVVTLFVLVWLVAAARQLQAARLALSDEAVLRERVRIEGELRATVGDALGGIAAQGEHASEMAGRDLPAAQDELRTLVEASRRALAEARRISTSYQRVSLRAELDTAATLLVAAGIDTRLELPDGDLLQMVDETMRSRLRSATARLLIEGSTRRCTIAVTREDGRLRLEVRTEGREPETLEVTA